jgi:hypothetical protein
MSTHPVIKDSSEQGAVLLMATLSFVIVTALLFGVLTLSATSLTKARLQIAADAATSAAVVEIGNGMRDLAERRLLLLRFPPPNPTAASLLTVEDRSFLLSSVSFRTRVVKAALESFTQNAKGLPTAAEWQQPVYPMAGSANEQCTNTKEVHISLNLEAPAPKLFGAFSLGTERISVTSFKSIQLCD